MLKINETRFLNFFEELKQFNATPNNGYTRRAFSEEDLNTIQWLEETLKEYDLCTDPLNPDTDLGGYLYVKV